jgi:positive regulator of sigma E activity
MNNPDERQLEENTIITDKLVERGEQVKKGIDSYVIYRFLIKVFLIYILPALFLIILGFFEESVFKAECNVETESELCFIIYFPFLL